jgi:hypothetical protein
MIPRKRTLQFIQILSVPWTDKKCMRVEKIESNHSGNKRTRGEEADTYPLS